MLFNQESDRTRLHPHTRNCYILRKMKGKKLDHCWFA